MSTKADAGKIPTNSSTITLRFPFTTAAGVQLTAVDTRRLKVKDLRRISKQSGGDEGEIETLGVAAMCGIVPEDLDDMDAADYKVVKDRFLEYVGVRQQLAVGAPATGEVVPAAAE